MAGEGEALVAERRRQRDDVGGHRALGVPVGGLVAVAVAPQVGADHGVVGRRGRRRHHATSGGSAGSRAAARSAARSRPMAAFRETPSATGTRLVVEAGESWCVAWAGSISSRSAASPSVCWGAVVAWDGAAERIALKGPRQREVLALLILARGRVVSVARSSTTCGTRRRRAPPGRCARSSASCARRSSPSARPGRPRKADRHRGLGLRAPDGTGDRRRVAVRARRERPPRRCPPKTRSTASRDALDQWRGPAYADLADAQWARAERSRLTELRLHAVERRAEARIALGNAAEAVPDLEAHVAEHPGARTPGACSRSRSIARAAKATPSRSCAARGPS